MVSKQIALLGLAAVLAIGGCGRLDNNSQDKPKEAVAVQIEKQLTPLEWKGRTYNPAKVHDAFDKIRTLGKLEEHLYQEYMPAGDAIWRNYEETDSFSSGSQAIEAISKLLSNTEDDCYINEEEGVVRILYYLRWSSRNYLEIVEAK